MAKVKGYVAKYNYAGYNGTRFMPGCFDKNRDTVIPVVREVGIPSGTDIIGEAQLSIREDGLYCEANVDLSKIDYQPKSFCFFGNKVEYAEDRQHVKNVNVISVSLSSKDDIETSCIDFIEEADKTSDN